MTVETRGCKAGIWWQHKAVKVTDDMIKTMRPRGHDGVIYGSDRAHCARSRCEAARILENDSCEAASILGDS